MSQQPKQSVDAQLHELRNTIGSMQGTLDRLSKVIEARESGTYMPTPSTGYTPSFPSFGEPLTESFQRAVRTAVAQAIDPSAVDSRGQWILRREVVSEAQTR